MIIKQVLLSVIMLFSSILLGQNKQDYYWGFGFDQDTLPGVQASEFDFNVKPFEPQVRQGGLRFDQNNASICDKDGNLLFYTNGCAVANRIPEMMPEGDSINAGVFFDYIWGGDCRTGYPGTQDITILPDPGNEDGYYIIHKPVEFDTAAFEAYFEFIRFSYVDLSLDSGYGDVVVKNKVLYQGEVIWSYLTSMKHANGHDWWIINPVFPDGYLTFLLSEEGLILQETQQAPLWDRRHTPASGDARFSPDGKKYALFNKYDGLNLYDFDRETGKLSGHQILDFARPESARFATCEWSPSSQFLYLIERDTVWQLDTTVEPLIDGLVFIDEYDGSTDPTFPNFKESALGPDCRIYIRPGSSTYTFHVINKPDEKGAACDFVQRAIKLPYISSVGSFPNFPRFRVDDDEKCDPSISSIVGETVWWRRDLQVYPSPTLGPITIELPEGHQSGRLYAVNMQGQVVLDKQLEIATGEVSMDLSNLPEGIYSVEFLPEDNKERIVWTSRVVVTKA